MTELKYARITILWLLPLMFGAGIVCLLAPSYFFRAGELPSVLAFIYGMHFNFSTPLMILVGMGDSGIVLCSYTLFLILSIWVLRFFSHEMRVAYISLMHMLFAALWLWYAYLVHGSINPSWCGNGVTYVEIVAKAINIRTPERFVFMFGMVAAGMVYGGIFALLVSRFRKSQAIKVNP